MLTEKTTTEPELLIAINGTNAYYEYCKYNPVY